MISFFHKRRFAMRTMTILLISSSLSGCYVFEFFKRKSSGTSDNGATGAVLGRSLGNYAGEKDDAALAEVYAATTDVAPAAVRPDPDLLVRRLLRQFRPEGATIAREIGRVEEFKLLLGGASTDFQTAPQDSYDATSLLATLKVAEEICQGLVAPTADRHPGWQSILPAAPSESGTNLRYLAQRFIGLPSARIPESVLTSLQAIMDSTASGSAYTYDSYVPACATLAVDGRSLLL